MTVKLEVPFTRTALAAAAAFFGTLANSEITDGRPLVQFPSDEERAKMLADLQAAAEAPDAPDLVPDADDLEQESAGDAKAAGVPQDKLPWDPRIHTANKATVKDGSFRYKPGIDKALIAQVEAELRQNLAAGGNHAPAPDVVPDQVAEAPAPDAPAATTQQAATVDAPTFASVMVRGAEAVKQSVLSMADIDQWCKDKGLAGKAGLAMNATVRKDFSDYLTLIGF
jgi:hypothetical protein